MKNFKLSQQHLKRNLHKLKKFTNVRIWSGQWEGWWRYEGRGYTDSIVVAWVLPIEDAWKQVEHCGPEKKVYLCEAVDLVKVNPCPFCGSKATHTVGSKIHRMDDIVMCTNCDASMESDHLPYSALAQWNRRV